MTKKRKSSKNHLKKTIQKHVASWQARLVAGMAVLAVLGVAAVAIDTTYAATYNNNDVLITSSAQAKVTNVEVSVDVDSVRVQFDYDLANGATEATIDAALYSQRSFGVETISGPGHYDKTLTEVADGNYYIAIIISGNPDSLLADPGPSNQPLLISIPDFKSSQNGTPSVRDIKHYYHQQQRSF